MAGAHGLLDGWLRPQGKADFAVILPLVLSRMVTSAFGVLDSGGDISPAEFLSLGKTA